MQFETEQPRANIKVVGVGGCGGNVVRFLQSRAIEGVRYAAVNTDAQALGRVDGADCLQIGQSMTRGLGAGARPEVAASAAREETERLREMVKACDMIFITAGMGKGTGTGASPIVAEIARDLGILTVAVVTRPFAYEKREKVADAGLAELSSHVDSLIVVPNEKLREVMGRGAKMSEAFSASNEVLFNAVCGIAEVITKPGEMNLDFNDVRSVMASKGKAVIGSACEGGADRASRAIEAAIKCPLIEDVDISSAAGILVNITASENSLTLDETGEVMEAVEERVGDGGDNVFFGTVYDDRMEDNLRVTVIVTGIEDARAREREAETALRVVAGGAKDPCIVSGRRRQQQENGDVPAILRRQLS